MTPDAEVAEWVREQLAEAPPITERTLNATAAHLRDTTEGGGGDV